MSKVTHAYVCYLDDNEKLIVKVSDIKAFQPENFYDFDNSKKYQVLWYDKVTKKSNYYSASILLLGSSKKNLEQKIEKAEDDNNSTKLRQTRVSSSESDRSSDDEERLKKKKKYDSPESNKSTMKLSKANTCTPNISLDLSTKKTLVDEIYEQMYELKNRVISLENENTILLSDVSILKEEIKKLKQDSMKNNHQNGKKTENDLMVLPEDPLGDKILGLYEPSTPDFTGHPTSEIEYSTIITVDESSSLNNDKSLLEPSYNRYQKVIIDDPISGGKVEKIYLDEGIFISSETWDSIKNQNDDSKFAKNLAQAIWTRHELVNRSLDGKGAARIVNRSPRKGLTPKKRQVIEACFQDRITKQQPGLTGSNLEKAVKGSGRYLTELINYLIKREVKNSKK